MPRPGEGQPGTAPGEGEARTGRVSRAVVLVSVVDLKVASPRRRSGPREAFGAQVPPGGADTVSWMPRRHWLPLALVALALLPGCGASEQAAGTTPQSAALAPADAVAYVTLVSDQGSEEWRRAERLLGVFPAARAALLDRVRKELAAEGLDWEEDVAPAVGPELVVVATAQQQPVILTQPRSVAKLDALLAKSDEPFVRETVGEWTALAERPADLADYRAALGRGTLQDSDELGEALADLPEDALARAWIDVSTLGKELAGALEGSAPELDVGVESVAAAISAEDDGLRLSLTMKTAEDVGGSYEPELFRRVPADAVVAVSFGGTQGVVDRLQESVDLQEISAEVEEAVGVSLDRVLDAFRGEGLLYVRGGEEGGIPEVTLALAPPDRDEALRTIDQLAHRLADELDARVVAVRDDGVDLLRVDSEGFALTYGEVDETVLVTTGTGAVAAFRGDREKLADSGAFERAAERVGLEDRTAGFAYVDVDGLVPFLEGLAGEALPTEARQALGSLDSFILQSEDDDGGSRLSGFVRVADR